MRDGEKRERGVKKWGSQTPDFRKLLFAADAV